MADEDLGDALNNLDSINSAKIISLKNDGNTYYKQGFFEEALDCYNKALQLNPNNLDVLNNKGLVLIKLGRIDEAKECNKKITELKNISQSRPESKPVIQKQIKTSAPNPPPPTTNKPNIRIPTDVSLTEGEIPIWFGQMSWAANWVWFLAAIVFCWTIILPIIFVIFAWINVATSEYFISNKRIYYKYGLIQRAVNDIKMEWVTNTSIAQGFVGRILNFGDVLIATPGTITGTSMFWGPSNPMGVKGIIETRLANYKKIDQISQSLRTVNDEFKMGRLDEDRYNSLKSEYEKELEKY